MSHTAENKISSLTAGDVAEYLTSNLDFFDHQPDLLLLINSESKANGSVSLVERQLKGLRARVSESQEELGAVIKNAQDNQTLLEKTTDLALKLIPCRSFSSLFDTLETELKTSFDVNSSNLLLNDSQFDEDVPNIIGLQNIKDGLGDNFPNKQPVCARLKPSEKELLFKDCDNVQSVAILPLGDDAELGLLVLGSEDPRHFDPEMGDLFLVVISQTISQLLIRLKH